MKTKEKVIVFILSVIIGFTTITGIQSLVQAAPQAADFKAPFVAPYYEYKPVSFLSKSGTIGWNTENGKKYYMPYDHLCYAGGIANIDNKYYCFDNDGYAVSGWIRTTEKVRWSLHARSMFFDHNTKEALIGYHRINGIGRYFNNYGFLSSRGFEKYTINNTVYLSDKAGIVSPVEPLFPMQDAKQSGITILREGDMIDGEYEFQAKVGKNTVVEPFGFNLQDSERIYGNAMNADTIYWCMIPDDTLKGKIGAWYRNAGVYKGRSIDVKFIISDYTMLDLFGREYGTIGFHKNMIGIAQHNLYDSTCRIEFYDHQTQEKVTVKGFATIDDIDYSQACEIMSPYDNFYISDQCELLYGTNGGRPVFADDVMNLKVRVSEDLSGQAIVNYTGDYFSFKFYSDGSLWKNDLGRRLYLQVNMPCFSENDVMYDDLEKGVYSWQGYQATRFARVTTPNPVKNVTDMDEDTVRNNTLSSIDEEFYYKISHNVPLQNSKYYYSEYRVTDQLESCLQYVGGKVVDDDGNDKTGLFHIEQSGNQIAFICKQPGEDQFYGSNYHFLIYVKINKNQDNSAYIHKDADNNDQYIIPNKASVHVKSNYEDVVLDTNEVSTFFKILLAKGDVIIHKTDKGTGSSIEGVDFSVYEWNKASGRYNQNENQVLTYSKENQIYFNAQDLIRSEENEGKFKIVETKNADGYTGNWEVEFQITCEEGKTQTFEYNVTNTRLLNLKLNKTIYADECYSDHGNQTFIFLVQGKDVNGKERYYTRQVTFTPSYVSNNQSQDGKVSQSVSIHNIPAGNYVIKEKNVSRYTLEDVIAVTDNITVTKNMTGRYYDGIQPIQAYVSANLLTKDGEVIFVNRKITWDKYSHNDISVNHFSTKKK